MDRYGQWHAINEPSGLESGKCSIASLETQMVRRRWIPVQIGLHEAAALRPWMLVPESLVALAAEVRLTYIGVSKTNDHSRELTVLVQKTELVQTKVKWEILKQNITSLCEEKRWSEIDIIFRCLIEGVRQIKLYFIEIINQIYTIIKV
ncbi:Hypothetical_protein [Hexamita inflata]|uniref:Hypothetical_protein n=1 Tax=Hexamita inflata TaxID=28002 RepID=A0AA86UIL4_9EUKA|nr:Hypothetical protein HINF_LOCUS40292 [Hexamita inflata]